MDTIKVGSKKNKIKERLREASESLKCSMKFAKEASMVSYYEGLITVFYGVFCSKQ